MQIPILHAAGIPLLYFSLLVQADAPKASGVITIENNCQNSFEFYSPPTNKTPIEVRSNAATIIGNYQLASTQALTTRIKPKGHGWTFYLEATCSSSDNRAIDYHFYPNPEDEWPRTIYPLDALLEPLQRSGSLCNSIQITGGQGFTGSRMFRCRELTDFKLTVQNCSSILN